MGGGVVAVAAAIVIGLTTMDTSQLQEMGFRSARILAWLSPEDYASGTGFQTLQSLYAIGSGGLFGKGIGQSMQKLGYLPEVTADQGWNQESNPNLVLYCSSSCFTMNSLS